MSPGEATETDAVTNVSRANDSTNLTTRLFINLNSP
jgi:hypothetical protein